MKLIDSYKKAEEVLNNFADFNYNIEGYKFQKEENMGIFCWENKENGITIYATPYWEDCEKIRMIPIEIHDDNGEVIYEANFEFPVKEEKEFFKSYMNLIENIIRLSSLI